MYKLYVEVEIELENQKMTSLLSRLQLSAETVGHGTCVVYLDRVEVGQLDVFGAIERLQVSFAWVDLAQLTLQARTEIFKLASPCPDIPDVTVRYDATTNEYNCSGYVARDFWALANRVKLDSGLREAIVACPDTGEWIVI